jgi:hypothetical protein
MSRKDALIAQLRGDESIVLADPESRNGEWKKWQELLKEDGGLEGVKWKTRIDGEIIAGGETLRQNLDSVGKKG